VTVRWVDPHTGHLQTCQTDNEGEISVHVGAVRSEGGDETTIEIFAPGYENWSGTLSLAFRPEAEPETIRLHPCGSIEVRLSRDPARGPVELVAQAISVDGYMYDGLRTTPDVVSITGLRPGAYFDVHAGARGFRPTTFRDVQAGWPEPTTVEVDLAQRVGFEVLLGGDVEPDDCESLSVSLVGPGGLRGRASRAIWDPIRGLAIARPEILGTSRDLTLDVRGPFGVELVRRPWKADGSSPAFVELSLERASVPLIVRDGHPAPGGDWIEWKGRDRRGRVRATGGVVDLAWTAATPVSRVDLVWGELLAAGVELPRSVPIELARRNEGEVRILDVPPKQRHAVALVGRLDGEPRVLTGESESTELRALVPAGAYQLLLEGGRVGPPLVVHASDVTVVSLRALRQTSTLVVELPTEDAGSESERVVQVLHQRGDTLTPIRSTAAAPTLGEVRLEGLPPGAVVVQVRSEDLGDSTTDVILRSGTETRVVPTGWNVPREVTVRVLTASGAPHEGLRVKLWLAPSGASRVVRARTDAAGEARIRLSGEGCLVVSTEEGVWNEELGPTQTFVEVRPAGEDGGELRLELAGWWRGRVRLVGVLTPGSGPLYQMARRISDDEFLVPRRDAVVALTIQTRDGEMIFVQEDFGRERLRLTEEAPMTRLRVGVAAGQDEPHFIEPRVLDLAGVPVGDAMLTSALGRVVPFGKEITFRNTAPLTLVVDGIAAHGGTCWRTEPLRLSPGLFNSTLTLRETQ